MTLMLLACTNPTDSQIAFDDFEASEAIAQDFAWEVVVADYELLADRLGLLEEAVLTLQADPAQANLEASQQAWISAREPWELSEGFLFGPVDAGGYDPALDSWPVNRTDMDAVLASDDVLTQEYVSNLDPTLKGFHTAEYLLFGVDSGRTADDLSDRELEYLVAVTAEMASIGDLLAREWTNNGYAELVATAGALDNTVYTSRQSLGEEMVRGMIGILDEVANGKIADPYDEADTTLVESQFSFNSLADFSDNIRSVQNVYTGDLPQGGTEGDGLDLYVAEVDPELDARVQQELMASLAALEAIEGPFRDAILDPDSADDIEAAQEAIRTTQTTMEQDLLRLFTN